MILAIVQILFLLLQLATYAIIASVILSWLVAFNVVNLQQPFVRALYTAIETITAPLYRPIRRLLPDFGGIDLSPIVVLLGIKVLQILLSGVVAEMGPTIT